MNELLSTVIHHMKARYFHVGKNDFFIAILLILLIEIWASLVAQIVKNLPVMWETRFDPWVGKIP